MPGFLDMTFTDRPGDKPAQFSGLKFPGRALLFTFRGALFHRPT
jgi:hypothetical protein